MQQPLAHLYFLTVLENLLTSEFSLSSLIMTVQNVIKVSKHNNMHIHTHTHTLVPVTSQTLYL